MCWKSGSGVVGRPWWWGLAWSQHLRPSEWCWVGFRSGLSAGQSSSSTLNQTKNPWKHVDSTQSTYIWPHSTLNLPCAPLPLSNLYPSLSPSLFHPHTTHFKTLWTKLFLLGLLSVPALPSPLPRSLSLSLCSDSVIHGGIIFPLSVHPIIVSLTSPGVSGEY